MQIKTSKFPVTAPDGTEYLVKIKEKDEDFIGKYATAKLYIARKWLGHKKVFETNYWQGDGVYNYFNPNFILIANKLVSDHYVDAEFNQAIVKQKEKEESQRMSALKRFKEWDGKINNI